VTKPLRVEDAARDELRAAVAWYEEKQIGLGVEFFAEVQRTLELIQGHPGLGAPTVGVRAERGTRRLPLRRFPYGVVYRERVAEIQVIAFAHTSRKPGYWRLR
jgi:plasmid stabilization system protein ParE